LDTFDTFDTFDTLKELVLSVNSIDIFVLFVDSNVGGTDSLVGGVGDTPEGRREAGLKLLLSLAHCPTAGRKALLRSLCDTEIFN